MSGTAQIMSEPPTKMDNASFQNFNYAKALRSIGNKKQSIDILKKIATDYPVSIEVLYELAISFYELGIFDEALIICKKMLKCTAEDPKVYLLIGHIYRESNEIIKSKIFYTKAIELTPNSSEAHHSLALAHKESNNFNEAFKEYDLALSLSNDNADIHNNRSILSLLCGNYTSGFQEYEWRKKTKERHGQRDFNKPVWRGEDLKYKTLLVHHEQGLGDAIQFTRYIKILIDKGFNVLYDTHPPLEKLLSSINGIKFVDGNNPSLDFDYHCPLLSLPFKMETTLDSIPVDVPYLFADQTRAQRWRKVIGPVGFKIGVAWLGSGGRFGIDRQFSASYLRPLTSLQDVRLIGLHKEQVHSRWDIPTDLHIESLGPEFDAGSDAFLDAAAVIECCDLIISCDTAIAHLAGAMGKRTWLILKHVPHWVWMMDRQDSPWYPYHRLFRQTKPGDWDSAFYDVYAEISKLIVTQ